MATYTVKSGENLYDIAMKLFGSVEGIFNLLVNNQDAIKEEGLSLEHTLDAGTVLQYTDNVINKDIADEIEKGNIPVRNGENDYKYYVPELYIESYVKKFNESVIDNALELWPDIASTHDADKIADFLKYVNDNTLWLDEPITSDDIASLAGGDYSKVENMSLPDRLDRPRLIIKQKGVESKITYTMNTHGMMLIDWGDSDSYEMCVISDAKHIAEHCYVDDGGHLISIYGDFSFSYLDMTEVGGVYYPLSQIDVTREFYSSFPSDSVYNRLINLIYE